MINLQDWANELNIETDCLKPKYKHLEGTRLVLQAENKDYVFTMSKLYKPKIETIGITNRCEDNKFVLFGDYDWIYKKIVYQNIENLLKQFPNAFDNFFIATTSEEKPDSFGNIVGSYHIVCFTKHFKHEIKKFLEYLDIDKNYKRIPMKTAHKCWVLRITKKWFKTNKKTLKEEPKFLEVYPKTALITPFKNSSAHYKVFSTEWKFTDPYYEKRQWDNLKIIELHKYSTPKVK